VDEPPSSHLWMVLLVTEWGLSQVPPLPGPGRNLWMLRVGVLGVVR